MTTSKFVCMTCNRTYRLKQKVDRIEDLLCFHCGSCLKEIPVGETFPKDGFRTLLQNYSQEKRIGTEELDIIEEMHQEGVVDTAWLKRQYQADAVTESQELDLEVVEEFKPLFFRGYQALYAVGEGGSGIVYKGWKMETQEIVAIKRLHPDKIMDNNNKERFYRELEFLKELSHPNILTFLDGGEQDGEFFLVSPFIEGGSLKERIQSLPPGRSFVDLAPLLAVLIQVTKALDYAHSKGLVHRDVKPANILLDGDQPFLADFGLAKKINAEPSNITKGAVGTPCYMPPEMWQMKVSPQADIYALGVILYEMITGTYPFSGNTPAQILAQQLHCSPQPPVDPGSSFPLGLNDITLKALQRDPTSRHTSAREFKTELTQILL